MRLLLLLFYFVLAIEISADLHQKVHYFETLQLEDLEVTTRKRRSMDGKFSFNKEVGFQAFGRKFNLILYPGSPVLSPNFKAKTIAKDRRVETFAVNPNNFYSGHLADDESVSVDAHFEDGILSSNIHFPHEIYVTEPAWRHLPSAGNSTMIAYRRSDVNWEELFPIDPVTGKRTKLEDGIRLFNEKSDDREEKMPENVTITDGKSRQKRAVRKNACSLLVVADYLFFKDIGRKKLETTAAFLIATLQHVNRYFGQTVWDPEKRFVNMGFIIEEMEIHTGFTNEPNHYNSDIAWHFTEKLHAFSMKPNLKLFCLGHLFTSYAFSESVLGLAFIASSSPHTAGGICSIPTKLDGGFGNPRTGWSTAKNSKHQMLLTQQLELVATHELGHSWGAEHDPHTEECAPSSRNNGKYVMWPYSVIGYEKNNRHFSPCSKRYVREVLEVKSARCFIEKTGKEGLCGNGIIEVNEECDTGFIAEGLQNACCDNHCQLRKGAECSDFNFACCKNCKFASSDVLCEEWNELACKDEAFCNGKDLECPMPGSLPDETPCIDMGKCYNGECLDFCALHGRNLSKTLTPCLCTQNSTAMCRRCCAEQRGFVRGECLPTEAVVQAGRVCHTGSCNEDGVCIKMEQRLSQRIFNFIKMLTADKLVEFMQSNIVGTVIVLSLLIWIPASLVINLLDKRMKQEEENKLIRTLAEKTEHHTGFNASSVNKPSVDSLSSSKDTAISNVNQRYSAYKEKEGDGTEVDEKDTRDTKGEQGTRFSRVRIKEDASNIPSVERKNSDWDDEDEDSW